LIQPLYIYPYEFTDTLKALNVKSPDDIIPALFVPCNAFGLTKAGADFFGQKYTPGKNQMISPETPESLLVGIALGCAGGGKPDAELAAEIGRYHDKWLKPAYEIKISYENEKSFWKRVAVAGEFTLHSLHVFICGEFNIDASPSYTFHAGPERNDFARYSPPDGKNRRKLTTETPLDDLGLPEGGKLLYTVNEVLDPFYFWDLKFDDVSLLIEIIKIKKPTGIEYYPQVIKESKAFHELDRIDDLDFDF